jgi:hypothetical protein
MRGFVSVQDPPYVAPFSGAVDAQPAIQQALDDVGAIGGGTVFLPTGQYLISNHLTIPANVTLRGVFEAPPRQGFGTTLLAIESADDETGTPFITLNGHAATLSGVAVRYPNQLDRNPPIKYPWTIRAGSQSGTLTENVTIQNVLLVNSYNGVDLATYPSYRHLVRSLYGQALHIGIAVDKCLDVGRIKDVHLWPFGYPGDGPAAEFTRRQGTALILRRSDWQVVEDFFAVDYAVGISFQKSPDGWGAMNGQLSNIGLDGIGVGLDVWDLQEFSIFVSNLNIANAQKNGERIGIWSHPSAANYQQAVVVRGAGFWGQLKQAVRWEMGQGSISLSDSRVMNWNPDYAAIEIIRGRANIQGCFFKDLTGVAIELGPEYDRVIIVGNELAGNRLNIPSPAPLTQIFANNA